ncbi:hypothetical protein M0R45_014555 [Rubus argutus]|uniref:Uncharacterized protein n=1 Tax=Rubus argutus TaxID=59490 RepID=A0AAW1XLL4_RUBAR
MASLPHFRQLSFVSIYTKPPPHGSISVNSNYHPSQSITQFLTTVKIPINHTALSSAVIPRPLHTFPHQFTTSLPLPWHHITINSLTTEPYSSPISLVLNLQTNHQFSPSS